MRYQELYIIENEAGGCKLRCQSIYLPISVGLGHQTNIPEAYMV